MTNKKAFFIGMFSIALIQYGSNWIWDSQIHYQKYEIWKYYPNAEALEERILKDYPIGTPVVHLMKGLKSTDLEFVGAQAEGADFKGYKNENSCCGFYYGTFRTKYLQGKNQKIRVDFEYDIKQNITHIDAHMSDRRIEWVP
jgi:hypothetical protein